MEERSGQIDALRGVAILSVIALHWFVRGKEAAIAAVHPALLQLGEQLAHGVDVFFVVSGFLIGRILIRHHGSPGWAMTFYVRRFLRIVPLYFGVLALILSQTIPYPSGLVPPWAYFLFVDNVFLATGSNHLYALGPTWSLAIEEQFYLAVALACLAFGAAGVRGLGIALVVIGPLYRVAAALVDGLPGVWSFTFGHCDGIGWGLLLAGYGERARVRAAWLPAIAGVAAGATIGAAFLPGNHVLLFDVPLASIATASMLLWVLRGGDSVVWRSAFLQTWGRWCFAAYILHPLVIMAWWTSAPAQPVLQVAGAVVTLALLCSLSWRCIEQPLIQLGRRWRYDGITGAPVAHPQVAND